jgi:hypothetical protein
LGVAERPFSKNMMTIKNSKMLKISLNSADAMSQVISDLQKLDFQNKPEAKFEDAIG